MSEEWKMVKVYECPVCGELVRDVNDVCNHICKPRVCTNTVTKSRADRRADMYEACGDSKELRQITDIMIAEYDRWFANIDKAFEVVIE